MPRSNSNNCPNPWRKKRSSHEPDLPSVKIAFRALRINKMRSALTMLGIIIGVAAVIAMVAIGSGATARIQDQIASIGSNLIMVIPGSITSSGIRLGTGNAVSLTMDDATAIRRECPGVAEVAPMSRGGAQVIYGNTNWGTSIQGTTPGLSHDSRHSDRVRRILHRPGCRGFDQRRAARTDRRRQSVRQPGPCGPEHPHQERARSRWSGRWCRKANRPAARIRTTSC